MRPMLKGLALFFVGLFALLWPVSARAFTPPPLQGHVVDTAGKLSTSEVRELDRKLADTRQSTGFAVVVFVVGSLQGESIEDVAYTTFNTWKVGSAMGDDGVLLVIAPEERLTRIETGKGVGGAITDLQSSRINRETINPSLKAGRYFEAIDRGIDAIAHALVSGTPGGRSEPGRTAHPPRVDDDRKTLLIIFAVFGVGIGGLILLGWIGRRRGGWRVDSTNSSGDSWSSSSYGDSGGSSYGGGSSYSGDSGSSYSGDGGSSGGGGSSDSW